MLLHRQCNDDAVLRSRSWRIVRIAIQPALQHRGLGTQLLHFVQNKALTTEPKTAPSFLGASFGGTAKGLRFWQQAGYQPFHWGFRLNPRSGQRALAVALCLADTPELKQSLLRATTQFNDCIQTLDTLNNKQPDWFSVMYGTRSLEHELLKTMMHGQSENEITAYDSERLDLWQQGHLGLHDIWGPLARRAGGVHALAEWKFPAADNTKQLTMQIKHRLFDK